MTSITTYVIDKGIGKGLKVVRVCVEDGVWIYISNAGPKHRLTAVGLIQKPGTVYFCSLGQLWRTPPLTGNGLDESYIIDRTYRKIKRDDDFFWKEGD